MRIASLSVWLLMSAWRNHHWGQVGSVRAASVLVRESGGSIISVSKQVQPLSQCCQTVLLQITEENV